MLARAASAARSALSAHPLLTNCGSYGALCGLAEFTQQLLDDKLDFLCGPWKRKKKERPPDAGAGDAFDRAAIVRMTTIGTFIMAPTLYGWYKFLDARFPGNSWSVVARKLVLDATVASVPLYSLFYVGTAFLEGQPNVLEEWRRKFLPTYVLSMLFWIPMQTINFAAVPPTRRVLFVAACTFVEINGLCVLKRLEPQDGKEGDKNNLGDDDKA